MSDKKMLIGERRALLGLVVDRALFWVSTKIRQRARLRSDIGSIIAPFDDTVSLNVFATGRYESTHVDAIRAIIDGSALDLTIVPGGIFVDVGANIGVYPIIFANRFKSVIALEANPIVFRILEANMASKEIANVSCINLGASNEKRSAMLYVRRNGDLSGGRLNDPGMPSARVAMQVQLDTLDNILQREEMETVSLLKIDVEGHEPDVLMGASRTLDRSSPVVLFEVHNPPQARACISILRQHGYGRFARFTRKPNMFSAMAYTKGIFEGLPVAVSEFDENVTRFEALVCAVKPSK